LFNVTLFQLLVNLVKYPVKCRGVQGSEPDTSLQKQKYTFVTMLEPDCNM